MDNFERVVVHLAHRDVTLVAASRAPVEKLESYEKRMGWTFNWVSVGDGDFNRDYRVTLTAEEIADGQGEYNYARASIPIAELPGISVFYKAPDSEQVLHTYSTYARGLDMLNVGYHCLEHRPEGARRSERRRPVGSTTRRVRRRQSHVVPADRAVPERARQRASAVSTAGLWGGAQGLQVGVGVRKGAPFFGAGVALSICEPRAPAPATAASRGRPSIPSPGSPRCTRCPARGRPTPRSRRPPSQGSRAPPRWCGTASPPWSAASHAGLSAPTTRSTTMCRRSSCASSSSSASFRDPAALRSFVVGITVRVVRSELRRRRFRRWLRLTDEGELPEGAAPPGTMPRARRCGGSTAPSTGSTTRRGSRSRSGYIEGLELAEVAAALGASLATTKRRLAKVTARVLAAARHDPALSAYLAGDAGEGGPDGPR